MPDIDRSDQRFSTNDDCVLKWSKTIGDAPSLADTKVLVVTSVKYTSGFESVDVSDRGAGGWVQQALTRRNLVITADLISDPTSDDEKELYSCFATRTPIALYIGNDRGRYLAACCLCHKWDIDQSDVQRASLEFAPTRSRWTPQEITEQGEN